MRLAQIFRIGPRSEHGSSRAARKTIALCRSLFAERGEVAVGRLAGEALAAYQALDAPGRDAFFEMLAREFSPDPEDVGDAGDAYRKDPSPENLALLQRVVEPPRQELFRRLNMAPGGTRVLVEMRGRVLRRLDQNPQWKPIAADLAHLFASWFNRGFLVLRRIDWSTAAVILEKLIQYEAVHQIQGWNDLRRRLESDRRCYAFFHPALPDEPIIFIEVALARGLAERVQPLLDPDLPVLSPDAADCAMFYSITNCQEGLRGISFGSFLIKQVVEDLTEEFPRIKKFATVSPIPGFHRWLREKTAALYGDPRFEKFVATIAKLDDPRWFESPGTRAELERILVPVCAYYLLHAKHRREPLDSVARFHLKNGARLERINWLGDTSGSGMQRSAGLMANYVYKLAEVERNHELYAREFKIAHSREIEAAAKKFVPPAAFA